MARHKSLRRAVDCLSWGDSIRTSDLLTPEPHSAKEGPSNRQQFLHGDPEFRLLKLPVEARLEALQAAKTLELGNP